MRILMVLCFLVSINAVAQVVDTWPFSSAAMQTQALAIAAQLRCPQCQNQNLLESNAPVAVSMRHEVFAMVEQGKGKAEIIRFMTRRYGEFVRYNPAFNAQTLILWGMPLWLFVAIVTVLWLKIRHQGRRQ